MENISEDKLTLKGVKPAPPIIEKKKRKTFDEYLGINGLLAIAIIGVFLKGGILYPIATLCGVVAIYYLIKKRKELNKNQKYIGWVLVVVWLVLFGLMSQTQ